MDLSRLGTALVTRWGAATDAGPVRRRNEDSWLAEPPLYAVADGMGGHADGAAASAAALHRLAAGMRPGAVAGAGADLVDLDRAIASAAADVAALADPASPLTAPGTTLTGALALDSPDGPHWLVFNIGDSRTCLVADGEIRRLTRDHSLLQEARDRGERDAGSSDPPDADALAVAPNVVTRALGAGGGGLPEPDYTVAPLRRGDRLILCSDGVHGVVPDRDLVRVVEDSTHPQAAAGALVDLAIARGTQDNATAVVVEATVAAHSRTTPSGAAHREVRAARPATVRTARRRHEGED